MALSYRRSRGLAAVLLAALALTACNQPSGGPTPAPPPPTATAPTGGPEQVQTACTNLATQGQALTSEVGDLFSGSSTPDDVRTAAQQLGATVTSAAAVLGPQVSANLASAQTALQQLQAALNAQPVDLSAARTAAGNVLTALRGTASVCHENTPSATAVPSPS
jgi:hypothetical protein